MRSMCLSIIVLLQFDDTSGQSSPPFAPSAFASAGVGFLPNIVLRYDQITSARFPPLEGYAVDMTAGGLSADVGMSLFPGLVFGLEYFHCSFHINRVFQVFNPDLNRYSYDGDMNFTNITFFARYLVRQSVGFRPFVELGIGTFTHAVNSPQYSGYPSRIVLLPIGIQGTQILVEVGSEYLPSSRIPLLLTAYGRRSSYLDVSPLLGKAFFDFGIKIGAYI